MTRVQIPAYTDRWMMGDRYGEIVKVIKRGKINGRAAILHSGAWRVIGEIAHVKLDKSGKTVRVILNDCEVVS
jgi:hypothetical protein